MHSSNYYINPMLMWNSLFIWMGFYTTITFCYNDDMYSRSGYCH